MQAYSGLATQQWTAWVGGAEIATHGNANDMP